MFQILIVKSKKLFTRIFFVRGSNKLSYAKRQKNPSTLQECLDRPERPRECWKTYLALIFLLPTIYYMFYYKPNVKAGDIKEIVDHATTEDPNFAPKNYDENNVYYQVKPYKIINNTVIQNPKGNMPQFQYSKDHLPLCAVVITARNVTVYKEVNQSIDNLYPMVSMGGYYNPPDCRSRHKVAILVPYRRRDKNLKVFLYNIHPFLMRQRLEYRIFVFEQSGSELFNKGRLFNAGFREIEKNDDWQCIIFHDVDLLPTDDRIRYTCPVLPRHMCVTVAEKEHIPMYKTVFGGVTAMTVWHFRKVNGYSNMYWGWGGEDTDMYKRLQASGLGVTRYKKSFARYVALRHRSRYENPDRYALLKTAEDRYKSDGLSSLHYRMVSYASKVLYTHIVINVNPRYLPQYITEGQIPLTL